MGDASKAEDAPNVNITPARISFLIGILAVLTSMWQGFNIFKDEQLARRMMEKDIEQVRKDMLVRDAQIDKLINSMASLNERVTELVYIIRQRGGK